MAKRTGRPPIGPQVTASVPPELDELLRKRAAARRQSLSSVIREAIERGVEHLDDAPEAAA